MSLCKKQQGNLPFLMLSFKSSWKISDANASCMTSDLFYLSWSQSLWPRFFCKDSEIHMVELILRVFIGLREPNYINCAVCSSVWRNRMPPQRHQSHAVPHHKATERGGWLLWKARIGNAICQLDSTSAFCTRHTGVIANFCKFQRRKKYPSKWQNDSLVCHHSRVM